jgi:hypothetical protein
MKTALIPPSSPSSSSGSSLTSAPAPAPSADTPEHAGPGRPSCLNDRMIDALRAVIRDTGISDSGAAARVSLHPSTVSRWKKEFPDLAILLRSAREEFRSAQLELIMAMARAGHGTSWRAAAWLLERTFPEGLRATRQGARAVSGAVRGDLCGGGGGRRDRVAHQGRAVAKCEKFASVPCALESAGPRRRPDAGSGARTHAPAHRYATRRRDGTAPPRDAVAKCEKFRVGGTATPADIIDDVPSPRPDPC